MSLTHINRPISDGTRRVEIKPNEAASTPSPMQTGWMAEAPCAVAVSGNEVTTREEVIVVSEKDVKVVEGSDTTTGIEVVNVVNEELRDRERSEVALAGMGEEGDVRSEEEDVTGVAGGGDEEGIAGDEEGGNEVV